jgi:hypothetical protein
MKTDQKQIPTQRECYGNWANFALMLFALALCLLWMDIPAAAQIGGTGSIEGTVSDPSGAVVTGATVTATNTLSGVQTTDVTTKNGYFVIPLLQPGPYTVTIKASGFENLVQEHVIVDALATVAVNPKLTVGAAIQSITVTTEPSMLMTDDVKLGSTIENETYDALPLAMNGSARDPTAFAGLAIGVNSYSVQAAGPSTGSFNGGQTYQNETYVEGLPLTSAGTESDTRNLAFGISVEAVEQFQVATAGTEATYEGQGVSNYVVKSGTDQFHGGVYEYFRNTIFDAKAFFSPTLPTTVEHQNEFGGLIGGPVPFLKHKLFFFANYDGYRYDSATLPAYQNMPTTAEQGGDFSGLLTANGGPGYAIYDPLNCTSFNGAGACTGRAQFVYNGMPNVIPPGRISAVSKSLQSYLPKPTNTNLTSNYLATLPNLVNNDSGTLKIDYDMSAKHRLWGVYSRGKYANPIVGSLTYAMPFARGFTGAPRTLLDGWQFSALLAVNSSTPFTVYDSANVSLQAPHPGVSGMFGDRPNVTGNSNQGAPHKVSQWVSPSAFQRLDPVANAGQFGDEGRNSVDGPAYGSLDASLDKTFTFSDKTKVQFRAESFNVSNHVNFIPPVFDMNSPAFGQITEAQAPRVIQFALKIQR